MSALVRMVNETYSPTDSDEAVIDVLSVEGRANPYLIREQTDLDRQTVNNALIRLTSAGWVRKVTRGLYEFVEDPRAETSDETIDWRDQLHDDLVAMGVTGSDRDRVEALAEFFNEHGTLSRRLALENDVVSEWGWDQAKDILAETSVVERPNQRTWRWVGKDD
jgi:DNA-directed RNA polymerase specialized sigma54-like protein